MRSDFGNIIIPFDMSETAFKAVKVGFNLAHKIGKEIVFLHVLKESQSEFDPEKIKTTIEKLNPVPNKVSYRIVVKKGVPENKIAQYAEKQQAFLIVMCTRTNEKKIQDLIGSVTSEVMRITDRPVLAIPESFSSDDVTTLNKIAYASSLKSMHDLEHIDLLSTIFPIDNKSLEIIHSVKENENITTDGQYVNTLVEAYPSVKISSKALVYDEQSSASTAISEYITNSDVELIVIKKHHRRAFLPLISTQFALKVLFRSEREEKNIPIIQLPVETETKTIKESFSFKNLFKRGV
jgi:nucleotide-binding universal stress UspA family protein